MSKFERNNAEREQFVQVNGTNFVQNGKSLFLVGANYWQAMNLGMEIGGNRSRVLEDLAILKKYGVNNIRVMAASEGPQGLDWALDQIEKHGMTATVASRIPYHELRITLSNYWHWSGGFVQYVNWAENNKTPIPYPKGKDFDALTAYAARFYSDQEVAPKCQVIYRDLVRTIITRRNTVNGKLYKDDPIILTWELANEPQAIEGLNAHSILYEWIDSSAAYIKSLDSNHLVTTGAEGKNGKDWFITMHKSHNIGLYLKNSLQTFELSYLSSLYFYQDFASAHVWVENWGYYNSDDSSKENFDRAKNFMIQFLQDASDWSTKILKKPVYLAEYGLARDGWTGISKYDPAAPITNKNKFYKSLCDKVFELEKQNAFAGQAFWAYSGIARPTDPVPQWLGDPPHEPQGWYGVYDTDKEILEILKAHSEQVRQLGK
ncbi:hypothetical protein G9A89_005685 [Geosiphon pyriformis]|nr:hypothetical protein G9A89_005685 [Geosiphon pyriformis]